MKGPLLFCLAFLSCVAEALPIESIAKIRALSPEEAKKESPVSVEGTVTYFDPKNRDLFIQDDTAGTYVAYYDRLKSAPDLKPGDHVQVDGWSRLTGYYPDMALGALDEKIPRHGKLRLLGSGTPPPPRTVREEELLAPDIDSQWIEVEGLVTGVERGGLAFTLAIEVNGWKLKAEIPKEAHAEQRAADLMQRFVRIRGVGGTVFNPEHQMIGRFLYVPSFDQITPLDAKAPGTLPPQRAIRDLLTYIDSTRSLVRVRGAITQTTKNGFYLRDSGDSVLVDTAREGAFSPGDCVEAEGYAAIAPFRPILKATRVRALGRSAPPQPLTVQSDQLKLPRYHDELVEVEAEFLSRQDSPDGTILHCRMGDAIFDAVLPPRAAFPRLLVAGDRLRLAGICELTTTHPTPRTQWVDGFRLHLPEADGVKILWHASWWNLRRAGIALGVVTAVAFGAMTWGWILRRKVRDQMDVIGVQLKREAVLEERERIARDLHDTVEQELTGLWIQLGNISKDIQKAPERALSATQLAQQMLRHCRQESRASVTTLRSADLEQMSLPEAIQTQLPLLATAANATLKVEVAGEVRPLGGIAESHLLRITQEAVANAVRHGAAQNIRIRLDYAGQGLSLQISDDGRGFDPSAPVPSGHFGLLGMRERAGKIQATLEMESALGAGTVLRVVVPLPPPNAHTA